jgi:Glycosyl hydrolase family 10
MFLFHTILPMRTHFVACSIGLLVLVPACGSSRQCEPAAPVAAAPTDDPAATLSGLRLEVPCKGPKFNEGELCHWDPALLQTVDPQWKMKREIVRTFGGTPGALYDVVLHIRGVVEPKNFTGGIVKEQHLQIGGTPVVDNYNLYNIKVSDPPATYTVNRHESKTDHFVFPIDYTITVPIRGAATVTVGAYDANDISIANYKALVVPGAPPAPDAFDGQFFQIDVVSAVARTGGAARNDVPPWSGATAPSERWSVERANLWFARRGWRVGVNYVPSTAVNQLEMWQKDTFDPATIDRELGWAESFGFTSVRVFLHDLAWKQDPAGFYGRMDQFLSLAEKHRIGTMFVIFDGVWNPNPRAGKQPKPRPYLHNSGWVQSPGAEILGNPARHEELEPYVKGVVERFKDDPRIDLWDVFNEPDNDNRISYKDLEVPNKAEVARRLLEKTFRWAREAHASQPLTAGPWLTDFGDPEALSPIDRAMIEDSDVITFHNYAKPEDMRKRVDNLRRYRRPILCTEYMARPVGSTFDPILGYLAGEHVGAYSWGFVEGKSQTIYPWDSWEKKYTAKPRVWFHDIVRADGVPYDPKEASYIRSVTSKR